MKSQPVSTSRTTAKLHLTILFSSFMRVCRFLRYGDDELPAHVALLEIAQRFRGLGEGVSLLHEWRHLAPRHQIAEELQIRLVVPSDVALEFLIDKARPERRGEGPGDASHLTFVRPSAADPGQDADAVMLEEAASFGKGTILDVVEEQVVALLAFGEIFFRVVDDVIGTERARYLHVSRADDCCDFSVERLRDLERECSDPARCAVDQNFLGGGELPGAQPLQRGWAPRGNGSGLLEGDASRLRGDAVSAH